MESMEIPIKISWWQRYKRLVLVPQRNSILRQKLDSVLNSGGVYYGVLRAIMYGEPWTFKVSVKYYRWEWENRQKSRGLNTHFVITESDCHVCIEDVVKYINEYGNARGTLTLYLP